ncbi:Calcium-binding component of the spindle pole body (SPB) half-bridge [Cladophialophora chaetospira]|uniref:Calmodulin n=1 Tax=Cladophialophora chaetospira TaxID=386627 RepID=A0AA38X859_9EURO|nr:Calcium-binding component of the spindle pole body (SPB) half-bridge [Cladophialophora chaetospira]
MSQGNPAFPGRNVYASSSKLPDRTAQKAGTNAPSQQYTQSTFGRRPEPAYQYGQTTAGSQQQHGRQSMEKEPNALSELSEEQRDEINESFSLFDLDRDRHLDYHETRVAMRSLGFTVPKTEISQIIHTYGVPKPQFKRGPPGRGQQSYHASQLLLPLVSFQRIAAQKIYERDPADEVERALLLFDPEQRGYIEIDDIRRVSRELGETGLTEDEIHAMVDEFDYDGTGSVSKEAFYTICLQ